MGTLALFLRGKMSSSYGLFTGTLAVGALQIVFDKTMSDAALGGISAVNIAALQFFILRAVQPTNSEIRNFLNQALPTLAILGMILLFTNPPHPYWLWPVGLIVFFGCELLFRVRGELKKADCSLIRASRSLRRAGCWLRKAGYGLPTAGCWVCIATIGFIWLDRSDTDPGSWEVRIRILATLLAAEVLYISGFRLKNRFTCEIARLLLLAIGVLCLTIAFDVNAQWHNRSSDGGQGEILAWRAGAALATLALASLAAFAVALSYNDPPRRASVPWWRGLIRPRHAVVVRTAIRGSGKAVENVPVVGAAWKGLAAGVRSLRYLKSGGEPPGLADVAVVASVILFGLAFASLVDAFLWSAPDIAPGSEHSPRSARFLNGVLRPAWESHTVAWTVCCVLLYVHGLVRGQSLFVFAGTVFALVPLVQYIKDASLEVRGVMLLTVGLVIIFCALMRWKKPFGTISTIIALIVVIVGTMPPFGGTPAAKKSPTCAMRDGTYTLPKRVVNLNVQSGGQRAIAAKDIQLSLRYVPDRSQIFCLDYLLADRDRSNIVVKRNPDGSLTSISSQEPKTSTRRHDPFERDVRVSATGEGATRKSPVPTSIELQFDPLDPTDLERTNAILRERGLCVLLRGSSARDTRCGSKGEPSPGPATSGSGAARSTARRWARGAIFYRPNLRYQLHILAKADASKDGPWRLLTMRTIELPNSAPTLSLGVSKEVFADNMLRLSFDHGVLTGIVARKKGESREYVELPLSIAHIGQDVPTQEIRVGPSESDNGRQIGQAQTRLLDALKAR
jgi:hypothetical protein